MQLSCGETRNRRNWNILGSRGENDITSTWANAVAFTKPKKMRVTMTKAGYDTSEDSENPDTELATRSATERFGVVLRN
jgi:hypothetical protein